MKTKKLFSVLAMAVALMFVGGGLAIAGDICGTPQTLPLWGGQTIPVGTVTVSNDAENIYVTYATTGGWLLKEVHLYVLDYEPLERLTPGKAPFKSGDISYGTTYTFTVPIPDWVTSCGESSEAVWLQAHAAVVKLADGVEVAGETAYGGVITKPRKGSWYGNITCVVQCCETAPPPGCKTETAWGGVSAGEGSAWWFYYNASVGGAQTIWAGQNTDVGTVEVSDGTLTITLTGDWGLQPVTESVKIQGYDEIPDKRPAAGQFTTYKGTALEVSVDKYAYYAIHLDVQLCE
jgi:hypothetical protein